MKKRYLILSILLLMIFITAKPVIVTETVKDTVLLWYSKVLPALLPTLILVKMILSLNFSPQKVQPFCLLMGILCGFPIGATTSLNFVKKGILNTEKGILYASLFNQFSPSFLITYISITCMNESPIKVIFILYVSQILLFLFFYPKKSKNVVSSKVNKYKNETFTTDVNYKVVDASILSSCEALIRICGYMVICNLINTFFLEICNNQILHAILAPVLELTGGAYILSSAPISTSVKNSLLLASVSFGGVSGIMQVYHMLKESGVSVKKYVFIKIVSFLLTGAISYICFNFTQ